MQAGREGGRGGGEQVGVKGRSLGCQAPIPHNHDCLPGQTAAAVDRCLSFPPAHLGGRREKRDYTKLAAAPAAAPAAAQEKTENE